MKRARVELRYQRVNQCVEAIKPLPLDAHEAVSVVLGNRSRRHQCANARGKKGVLTRASGFQGGGYWRVCYERSGHSRQCR